MEILKLFLLVIVVAINLDSIHSSCLSSGDSSGSNSVSQQSLSDAIIQYTLKQYKVMLKDPKIKADNIITSPYSIWSALALTYFGSRGQSSDVLGNLLGLNGMNKTKVEESVNQLRSAVSSSTGNTFTVANKIAVERSLRLKSCIVSIEILLICNLDYFPIPVLKLENDPFISVSKANFKSNPDGERIELNKWVESKTNDLISDLLSPGSVNSDTVLAIINAVYFKGNWLDQFDKELTREKTFTSVYKTSNVQMMARNGKMHYGNDDNIGASYVDLPYVDDKYSMLAILPYETNPDIDTVIGKMTSDDSSINLEKSFTHDSLATSIDLSGMLESKIPTKISNVFHKAFIKVEEKGTEAAAATSVLIGTRTFFHQRREVLTFNRPFALVLREKKTNTVLFMGVTQDPSLPVEKVDFFGHPERSTSKVHGKRNSMRKELENRPSHQVKKSSQVQMMYKDDDLVNGYLPDLDAVYVDIPYINDKFSMLAILPSSSNPDIDALIQKLTPTHIQTMSSKRKMANTITLGFPKFEVEEFFSLKDVLSEIGVKKIFQSIDLTGIIKSRFPMYVSDVYHKVFVKVEEKGTEAAGATAVLQNGNSQVILIEDRAPTVLGNLLGLNGMNKTKVEESVNQLRSAVSSNTGKNTFTVANTIAVERSLRLKSCIANDPFISVSKANFKYNSDGERIKLNKWVESKTNDLITDLLPPGSVNSLTVLAIINAVYFKGDWLDPFEKELTRETTFTSAYKTSKVQMMARQGKMAYGNDDNIGASYVDLPYIDDKYSMLAILPYETNPDIDTVIGKMTPTTLQSIWRSLSLKKVLLQFPRFEMTESFTLKDVLSKMGASSLFRSIDLSGVLESRIHTEISDVFHKAFIKVEEKGTEAAAATGILIATKTVSRIESLNFNRPFAFVLREKSTNTVLFMGVLQNGNSQVILIGNSDGFPYSIWSALALTYFGSRGQSSTVLGNLLGLNGMNKTKVEESVNQLRSAVSSSTGNNTFTVANKIAVEQSLRLKSCIANDPFISVSKANFISNPNEERIKLNKWVESKTNDLISDLLPPGSVNSDTVLAIINAVYFKGNWLDQFDKELTRERTFTSVYKTSKVQMMTRKAKMHYGYDDNIGASYVDLPYVDEKYSMLAILPYETNPDIDTVIGKMTPTTLQSIWKRPYRRTVRLQFPRFEMTESFNLKDVLSKMGASSLFRSINLSGMLESKIPTKISDVFHKAFIKVEEKGTEAAAATGIMATSYSYTPLKVLTFDRPFAFVLREKSTNTVLFMGVVRSL
ncbi:putative serpin-like protein [Nymphon striatum]|nr:putative serpin-like protein [Nymphon striatum]